MITKCTFCQDEISNNIKIFNLDGCDKCSNTLHKRCLIEYLSNSENNICYVCHNGRLKFERTKINTFTGIRRNHKYWCLEKFMIILLNILITSIFFLVIITISSFFLSS